MNTTLTFTPVTMGRAGEEVALQIEAAIIEGQLKPGDRLPSERDLQQQFNTGRGVIREALRALKEKDLLEIKKGAHGGAFVKEVEVANVSQSLALFLKQHRVNPESVVEFRSSLDRDITILAIARGTAEQKQQLKEKAELLLKRSTEDNPDMETISELDRQLNIELAVMTGNPVFEWIMQAIQLGFSSYDYALYEEKEYRSYTAANWVQTARAIADNEPLTALSCIGQHYYHLRKCIAENNIGPVSQDSGEHKAE